MDSVAAIVKGAVTAGITERVITSRVARRHYLMATLQPFKEGHHPEQYRVPSLDGKDRCKYTRQIFVQKGQRVKIGEPVKVSFFRQVAPGATLMYEDILYACDEDVCPEYTKDPRIKEVVTLTSDLSRKNLEKDFERMDTPQGTFYREFFPLISIPWTLGSLGGASFCQPSSPRFIRRLTSRINRRVLRHPSSSGRKRVQRRAGVPRRSNGSVYRKIQVNIRKHPEGSSVQNTERGKNKQDTLGRKGSFLHGRRHAWRADLLGA